jgi:hypothetical protein
MANGMILMRSLISGEEPKYLDAPPEWLGQKQANVDFDLYKKGFLRGKKKVLSIFQGVVLNRQGSEVMPKPTGKMIEFFEKRTEEHIQRVRKYLQGLEGLGNYTAAELTQRGKDHDADKYSQEKLIPYIWVTEYYRVKNSGKQVSEELKKVYEATREATGDHVTINRHHPEAHQPINAMNDLDIAEMVADWSSMAEELGEGSARGWADKNIGKKWEFDKVHTNLIYAMIEKLEKVTQ